MKKNKHSTADHLAYHNSGDNPAGGVLPGTCKKYGFETADRSYKTFTIIFDILQE